MSMVQYISGAQVRAARGILKWSVADLAAESGVSVSTIKRLESVDGIPNIQTAKLQAIQDAFLKTGRVGFNDEKCVCVAD
ncbi:MAG: helix-turn-helix transcriptional regulator [Candidatus Thiodiazotropha sp.]